MMQINIKIKTGTMRNISYQIKIKTNTKYYYRAEIIIEII